MKYDYCAVYIMTNNSRTLYVGVSGNLPKRVWQHKNKLADGFTKKYNIYKLVYYEQTTNIFSAIEREKQLKKWSRKKKIDLIEKNNPGWEDLGDSL
ncbi:MAG: GIY-YIG nuclease family protein [Candidatus Moranbacteria bacterium]|nr:GIY-YIG nuclease family protein [Candidatus Moranbacteria bacterium]